MKNIFKKKESVEKQPTLDIELEDKFKNIEIDILRKINKNLKAEIEMLRKKENHIRDLASISMFIEISKVVPDPEKAAEDSYRSADAFMRVRDRGKSYQEDILEKLKEIVANTPLNSKANEAIGAKVKMLITKY
jgi:hypothetical protein